MDIELGQKKPRRQREGNAIRRRRELIEATISSITQHGLSHTTFATVAREAGVSQGIFVFYFETKEQLFVATMTAHYEEYREAWQRALDTSGPSPVEKIIALVFSDLSDQICTRRNLSLWHAFWGEANAQPLFAKTAVTYDAERTKILHGLCRGAAKEISASGWTQKSFAAAVDALTDGLWIRMHISPLELDLNGARRLLAHFLTTVFPQHSSLIRRASR